MSSCPCPEHSPGGTHYQNVGPGVIAVHKGTPIYGYSRLNNGKILCQSCLEFFWPCQLSEKDGHRQDICVECDELEKITWRCPRCREVISDAQSKAYEYCPHCKDYTTGADPSEVCFVHGVREKSLPGDYKCCIECCHIWRTEAEFIRDVRKCLAELDRGRHLYEDPWEDGFRGVLVEPDPREFAFCPLCSANF